jgi:UDP-N-acetylmuramate: L-alanyl-gamma-D-glutamyl-meso-diaminopimelate ligase
VHWSLSGTHNVRNALAAVAAAHHAGVDIGAACEALESFEGVKRRQELLGEVNGVRVYDDFAHHPTAIDTTLSGLRARFLSAGRTGRLIAVIEPRSNTLKMGVHQSVLGEACRHADLTLWFDAGTALLDLPALVASSPMPARIASSIDALVTMLVDEAQTGDDIVIMSNGGFGGIHQKLLQALAQRQCA